MFLYLVPKLGSHDLGLLRPSSSCLPSGVPPHARRVLYIYPLSVHVCRELIGAYNPLVLFFWCPFHLCRHCCWNGPLELVLAIRLLCCDCAVTVLWLCWGSAVAARVPTTRTAASISTIYIFPRALCPSGICCVLRPLTCRPVRAVRCSSLEACADRLLVGGACNLRLCSIYVYIYIYIVFFLFFSSSGTSISTSAAIHSTCLATGRC